MPHTFSLTIIVCLMRVDEVGVDVVRNSIALVGVIYGVMDLSRR